MASAATLDPNLLERVKTILRRDLKLGPDAKIADDMGFFNSDVDLDSLDILLLVTSVEKEFGIKIPNEAVGREVFESVATLSRYIQEHGGASAKQPAAPVDHLQRLPHRDPFRFVTSLTNIREGESAEGVWTIT